MMPETPQQLTYDTIERELQDRRPVISGIGHAKQDISGIVDGVVGFAEKMGFLEEPLFGIKLATEEAVTNAYKRGNRMDKTRCYRMDAYYYDSQLVVRVGDEGEGFDPNSVPDPTLNQNLEEENGRGITLMRAYMDQVMYNPRGNVVVMIKKKR